MRLPDGPGRAPARQRRRCGRWFEATRGLCGSAGLFSEEYDIAQRQQRGNLPQTFVHAMMLECAARLGTPSARGNP
ncbi:glycoside hydrolase family 15 protein [Kitasatospora sp. NPDC101235]|uniref:glycoside hydrolase family 15 protein n=1 Tax=Kitasatospora sp. NPDC101235 TaxID=3364101 RepID=UPI00381572AD